MMKKKQVKVPVVLQLETLECGAASLCMIMAYYSKWVPLEQVRASCGVSRDGSRASNILKAARSYGFIAEGFRYEPKQLKNSGKFPCIIHWNFNHFVVLNGFKGDKAYINDPAKGVYTVTMEQFDKSFTGVCMFFEPSHAFVADGKPKSMKAFLRKRLKGAKTALFFVFLTTVLASVIHIINPVFSRIFLDRLLTKQNIEWLYPFLFTLSAFTFLTLIVEWIKSVSILKLNGKFAITANASFLWQVLRLPMGFFSQRMAGDIAMRQSLNQNIAQTLIETLAPLVLDFFMMVFYLVVMLRYSIILTIVGVLSILINLILSRVISSKRVNITRVLARDQGKLSSATVSGIEMIETIKAAGAESGFFEKWSGYQAAVNVQNIKFARLNQYLGMLPSLVTALTSVSILLLGVYLVLQGAFTVGMILAFQGFFSSFTAPVQSLIAASQTVQEMRTNMERVEDIMETPTDVEYHSSFDENQTYHKLSGELILKDVTFGYSRLEKPLIENFHLTLRPGSCVAFVGLSGCGKSTLSKLISGLYQPFSGEILFDGKRIFEIDHNVFTSSVAVVDQDIILFEDSIANNIRMWDNSIEDFEMIMAARDAKLHETIMQREGGYHYKILEGGKDLSGGQRQRLEIARVLAQDPTILILDEATSALDAKTEFEVVSSIKDRGITCIVIAHRLSTIRDCDEILVMEKGKVVERGNHEELYAKGGIYTALVTNE